MVIPNTQTAFAIITGPTARKGVVAVVDQGILSFVNFLTALILVRFLAKDDFGAYILAFMMMVAVNGFHSALITGPLTVLGASKDDNKWQQYYTTLFIAHLVLSGLFAITFVSIGLVIIKINAGSSALGLSIFAMGIAVFATQTREYLRKAFFARLRVWSALFNDSVFCLIQIAGVIMLWQMTPSNNLGKSAVNVFLTGWNVFFVMSVSAVLGIIFGARQIYKNFKYKHDNIDWTLIKESWQFGRWGLVSNILSITYMQATYFILGAMAGAGAVAQFEGPRLIVAPCILVLMGWSNIVAPVASIKYIKSGPREMFRFQCLSSGLLAAAIIVMLAFIVAFPDFLLSLLLGGTYSGERHTLFVWTAVVLMMMLANCAAMPFGATRRPHLGPICQGVAAVISLPLCFVFVSLFGVQGAVLSRLAAEIVLSVTAVVIVLRLRRELLGETNGRTA